MADIVITEPMELAAVETLTADFDVVFDPGMVDKPAVLERAAAETRALIVRNRTQVRGGLLDAARNLEVIGRLGVGLDNIDLEDCERRGIAVCPATGANTDSVAELVIGALFVLFRRAYHATDDVLNGRWPRLELNGREVQGHHLGLIGFGAIARAVAVRARALGMQVSAYDPNVPGDDPAWRETGVTPSSFDAVISESDAVSLNVPLTRETRHLIGGDEIAAMKDGAYLVHTARGGVVDDPALAEALASGKLGGAFLDVFEDEPLPAGSCFSGVPNLILSPHVGALTDEGNRRVSRLTAENVRRVLEENV